jgi:hypothetical protein
VNDLSWRATPAAVNDLEGDTCSCLCFFWRVTPAAVIDLSWRVAPEVVNDLSWRATPAAVNDLEGDT